MVVDKKPLKILDKVLYVIALILIINMDYSLFQNTISLYLTIGIGIICFFKIIICRVLRREKTDLSLKMSITGFIIPWIILTTISLLSIIYVYKFPLKPDASQSIMRLLLFGSCVLIAYFSVKRYGKQSITLFLVSGMISYASVFIQYYYYGGLDAFFHPFDHVYNGITLEVHSFTYCLGLILLYFLICDERQVKQKIKCLVFLIIFVIIGDKRTLYLGFFVTIGIYILLHKLAAKKVWLIRLLFMAYIVCAYLYIFLINSGILQQIFLKYNIDDMSRFRMWNFFQTLYDFSVTYIGKGIAYTDNLMGTEEVIREMHISIHTSLHNDILKIYIGWGFLPMLYYFYNFLVLRLKDFKKIGQKENGWKYFSIASFTFYLYFFDNMLTAADYNIAFFVVYFIVVGYSNNEKKIRIGKCAK